MISYFAAVLFLIVAIVSAFASADTCDDSYLISETSASPSSVFTAVQINAALRAHNDERRNVTVNYPSFPPTKMPMLQWDQQIAQHAQTYIDQCKGLVHSTSSYRSSLSGYSYMGENLYVSSAGNADRIKNAVLAWNAERKDYTFNCGDHSKNDKKCTGVVGHFTQNIWDDTTKVGCGYASCTGSTWKIQVVCHYFKGGNYVGQTPYTKAANKSQVADCQRGLDKAFPPGGSAGAQSLLLMVLAVVAVILSLVL